MSYLGQCFHDTISDELKQRAEQRVEGMVFDIMRQYEVGMAKQALYDHCCHLLTERIVESQASMDDVQQDSNSETKSSAGDKYETGRAMAQLEKERHARRKASLEDMLNHLRRIGCVQAKESIDEGALVTTNRGMYFVSVGLGLVTFGDAQYSCLSVESPFGQELLGLKRVTILIFVDSLMRLKGLNSRIEVDPCRSQSDDGVDKMYPYTVCEEV